MKICSICGVAKSEGSYFVRNKSTGRLHAQCKECYTAQRRINYAAHYEKYRGEYLQRAKARREELRREFQKNIVYYLARKHCVICGENDIRVLEFDHLDPADKGFTISQSVKLGYTWEQVLDELKKCQVLCANCHKRRTAQQFNWYKA